MESNTKFLIDNYYYCKLKSVKHFIDEDDEVIYLSLIYEYETDNGKYELIIPKLKTLIPSGTLPIIERVPNIYVGEEIRARWNPGHSNILETGDVDVKDEHITDVKFVIHTLEEYPLEVTMDDIEKKYGRKIKIVSEKGDKE